MEFGEVEVFWSKVSDGNMSLLYGKKNEVEKNKKKFLEKCGLDYKNLVMADLLGGTDVVIVKSGDAGKYVEGDALVTEDKGVVLGMVTADCFPVVFAEKNKLALVHLGYKGIDGELAIKVRKEFDRPRVWIGPGIRKESYIWKREELAQKNDPKWQEFLIGDDIVQVDLAGMVKKQLWDCEIVDSGIDTGSNKNYFSHYRSKRRGEKEARFLTVVGWRGDIA